jgi:hypothetical protein
MKIGYLITPREGTNHWRPSKEESAGWNFLRNSGHCTPLLLPMQSSVLRRSSSPPPVLWWHDDSSVNIPATALAPDWIEALLNYLRSGGSLFLSLLAARYPCSIGLERARPNVVSRARWKEKSRARDYPDIRGLAGFKGHPLFHGLCGAAYTWVAHGSASRAVVSYEGRSLPLDGSVIAVERRYIMINHHRRVAWEYSYGKGRVLAIGMHFYFADQSWTFRPHLEKLAHNAFFWLGGGSSPHPPTYWDFSKRTVKRVHRMTCTVKAGEFRLPRKETLPSLLRKPPSGFGFDVGGRRVLAMGTEEKGIEEIWVHPLRVLRSFRSGLVRPGGKVRWLDRGADEVRITPERVTRTFAITDGHLSETVFAHLTLPAGVIAYTVRSSKPIEFLVTGTTDLRVMWPLPAEATGSLKWWYDNALHALGAGATYGVSAMFGLSRTPDAWLCGQFRSVRYARGRLIGVPTKSIQTGFGFTVALPRGEHTLCFIYAGSSVTIAETEAAFRTMISHPSDALRRQHQHTSRLLGRADRIKTVDQRTGKACTWALLSLDRFMAHTPEVGRSLMAGYGPTRAGWNGGHAVSGRPGYAWYFGRDTVWSCLAFLAMEITEPVRQALTFLARYQDITGKIPHEVTTSGFVHYDAADATPLFAWLAGLYTKQTGDLRFARRLFPFVEKAINFCFAGDSDGDHLIENTGAGHGWVEGGPLFPVHAELYLNACWAAGLREAAFLASMCGEKTLARKWKREYLAVKQAIHQTYRSKGIFAFAKRRNGTLVREMTVMPAVAVALGLISGRKAKDVVRRLADPDFLTHQGVRLVSRRSRLYNPAGYHYGSIWPLFTGWAALAARATGQDTLHDAFRNALCELPFLYSAGHAPEVLHGEDLVPAGVCQHQAWSDAMVLLAGIKNHAPCFRLSSSAK